MSKVLYNSPAVLREEVKRVTWPFDSGTIETIFTMMTDTSVGCFVEVALLGVFYGDFFGYVD